MKQQELYKEKQNIIFPPEFDEFMTDHCNKWPERVRDFTISGNKGLAEFEGDTMKLSFQLWLLLFDKVLDPIICHIKTLAQSQILKNKLKYMCFVGGFSQSEYVHHRMNETFGNQYSLIYHEKPMLCVVEGAVFLSILRKEKKKFVTHRVMSRTYGVNVRWPLENAKSNWKVPKEHIEKYHFQSPADGKWYVQNCFRPIVHRGETITVDQIIERSFVVRRSDQKKEFTTILYVTAETEPVIVTGCTQLMSIVTPLPHEFNLTMDQVVVRFYFGETTIKICTLVKGKVCTVTNVDYDFDVYGDNIQDQCPDDPLTPVEL